MSLDPNKSWIVVTGGGTGMGRQVALDQMALGRPVVLVGRRAEPLQEVAAHSGDPADVAVITADLGDVDQVQGVVDAIGEVPVRAIVAAAGGQGSFMVERPTTAADVARVWSDAITKNLMSAVTLVESLLPRLVRGGRIVLIGSDAGLTGQGGPYAVAKAAVHAYAQELAGRIGSSGATANAVAPGYVTDTGFFDDLHPATSAPETLARVAGATLVGRLGKPQDIAGCVNWLLSDTGGWISGQTIAVNGGSAH